MPSDHRWPRASDWLADGPGERPADLVVLGVPASATSLSETRAHETPAAIRAALARFGTYAAARGADLFGLAPLDLGDLPDPDADEDATAAAAAAAVAQARLLVALGGDNSLTYAVMRGAVTDLPTAGLVTLDAHHDLRDGVSNGSPVRRLVEAGLDPHRVVQVGIADFVNSRAYTERARDWGITVVTRQALEGRAMATVMAEAIDLAGAGGGDVYVDLDVDVCDRAVAPACPASAPGGISALALRDAAYAAGADPRVRAVDVTEVDAAADTPDGRTVRLVALCLLEAAAGLTARPAARPGGTPGGAAGRAVEPRQPLGSRPCAP
ncbi:MAG: arginase family protein [Actinomycetes bacterium]